MGTVISHDTILPTEQYLYVKDEGISFNKYRINAILSLNKLATKFIGSLRLFNVTENDFNYDDSTHLTLNKVQCIPDKREKKNLPSDSFRQEISVWYYKINYTYYSGFIVNWNHL